MSWSVRTCITYAGHIRVVNVLAAAQPGINFECWLDKYIQSICARGKSKPYMQAGIDAVRALHDMGWIGRVV